MRVFLFLLLALGSARLVAAQATSCPTLATENAALRDQVAGYEARLGLNTAKVSLTNGDAQVLLSYVSCKASRSTHKLTLAVLAINSGDPTRLTLYNTYAGIVSQVLDEQGQGYKGSSDIPPMVGASQYAGDLPTGISVQCTLSVAAVPTTVTKLGAVVLSMERGTPGKGREVDFKTTLRNVPVTWIP